MSDIIQATNIHRSFGKGDLVTHVLRGIDITVASGDFVAIMGKSGAGKSTLMYQLSVLDTPTDGELLVDDTDVLGLSERDRTAFRLNTLGYVFQDYALVPDLNARENIMVPLLMAGRTWESATATADTALNAVGLSSKHDSLPSQLSGGEQQRVAIARAIAGEPKILFADEPTANLDSISGQQVIDLIGKLHNEQGLTVVMVTHEEEYTKYCNRIIEMEDGTIVSEKKR
ncbi:ABC transporter ATP-binding protein [Candidatus Kaiserbacteria bacterium]|nr:ABC transporter ATP-binding protein [Candidatus Kaiserbacteria bacterium]